MIHSNIAGLTCHPARVCFCRLAQLCVELLSPQTQKEQHIALIYALITVYIYIYLINYGLAHLARKLQKSLFDPKGNPTESNQVKGLDGVRMDGV